MLSIIKFNGNELKSKTKYKGKVNNIHTILSIY